MTAENRSTSAKGEFVITRVFDAPRALVWKVFTESEHLAHWWGPKGFTVHVAKLDFRPGGIFHYSMRSPEGQDMWGRFVYREIVRPERIVWVNSFSDKDGGLTRPPFKESWPLEMLSTLTLAEHEGRTTLTIHWVPLNPTEAERKTFEAGHDSMQQGWTGTLDQLAAYLVRAA